MKYIPESNRYDKMIYRRSGNRGLMLPLISLGLSHNFGGVDLFENSRRIIWKAFDMGITHFDLGNNYGDPPGSVEENFGKILKKDFLAYREELIISTKAGYRMWLGPYGEWGSRKYLLSSLDQSLKRIGVEYVDIFYSHRPDPDTPLAETMMALDQLVRQGKALYVGLSNYPADMAREAADILRQLGTPCLIHQPRYSMFERWVEDGLLDVLKEEGMGCIAFSTLAKGLLTGKCLDGIPEGSRVWVSASGKGVKPGEENTVLENVLKLNEIAINRSQTLSQMALAWLLKDSRVTSVLIGVSNVKQLEDNLGTLNNLEFSSGELDRIEHILNQRLIR